MRYRSLESLNLATNNLQLVLEVRILAFQSLYSPPQIPISLPSTPSALSISIYGLLLHRSNHSSRASALAFVEAVGASVIATYVGPTFLTSYTLTPPARRYSWSA
jgi:hypothetical protein